MFLIFVHLWMDLVHFVEGRHTVLPENNEM